MEAIIKTLFELIKHNTGYCTLIVVIVSACIEVTPIKISPITWFVKWVGDRLNGDIKNQLTEVSFKLEQVSNQLNEVSDRVDKTEINDMRSTILDFANSCMNERRHTQEEFVHMIDLYSQYEEKIEEKHMTNGQMDLAYDYIKKLYAKCLEENSFLK